MDTEDGESSLANGRRDDGLHRLGGIYPIGDFDDLLGVFLLAALHTMELVAHTV